MLGLTAVKSWRSSSAAALFVGLLFLIACETAHGDGFDTIMDRKRRDENILGASVVFFDQAQMSEPIIRGYGRVASSPSSAPVSADTAFMLASVSKVFAASAVAILVDRGILRSLDEDICNVLPADWKRSGACRNPNHPNKPVTWRMLVTHRSSLKGDIADTKNAQGKSVLPSYGPTGGYLPSWPADGNPTCPLTDVQGFYRDYLTNVPTTTSVGSTMRVQGGGKLDWYKLAQSKGGAWKDYAPGSKSLYSNMAFGYLAALVELATKEDFSSFCKRVLFDRLGMSTTAWFSRDLPPSAQLAMPVTYRKDGQSWRDMGDYCFIDYTSGELRTSARDMSKWAAAMMNEFGAPTLWKTATGRMMVTCQEQDAQGRPITPDNTCEFGTGWIRLDNSLKNKGSTDAWLKRGFKDYDWTNGILHDGAEVGSQTQLIILPNAGIYAAVLTNTDGNGGWAAQNLAAELVRAAPSATGGSPSTTPPPPTASPPTPGSGGSNCRDSTNGVFWVNPNLGYKGCSWLKTSARWTRKLCNRNRKNKDADFYCQATCQSCSYWNNNTDGYNPEIKLTGAIPGPQSCTNAKGQFWVRNERYRSYKNCDWLRQLSAAERRKLRICGYNEPGDFVCQKFCQSCRDWN